MHTLTPTYEELAPLILDGDGYQLTIAPEAKTRKLALLEKSSGVVLVTSNDQSADAQHVSRSLAAMRIEVEKCRKLVVAPVNEIVKKINNTAADFVAEITAEENRIKQLVGDHAIEQTRLKLIKEAEERAAFEAARKAREEALAAEEAAAAAKEGKQGIAAVIAAQEVAKAAEAERQATLAQRMDASAEVADTKVAQGVRFAWDFEVVDIHELYHRRSDLVTIEPKRAAILAMLKALEDNGENVELVCRSLGLKCAKKPIVSSR